MWLGSIANQSHRSWRSSIELQIHDSITAILVLLSELVETVFRVLRRFRQRKDLLPTVDPILRRRYGEGGQRRNQDKGPARPSYLKLPD